MAERHAPQALPRLAALSVSAVLGSVAMAADDAGARFEIPSEALEARTIEKWQADGSRGIWLQVAGGQWLYATFQSPCTDLPTSVGARFRWSLSSDLQVGASVMTASGSTCAVRRVEEVKGVGSMVRTDGRKVGTELEGVVVEGRDAIPVEAPDVPRCGLRSIVWALTRPGSAWRLITPVENPTAAAACLSPPPAGYRWSAGTVP